MKIQPYLDLGDSLTTPTRRKKHLVAWPLATITLIFGLTFDTSAADSDSDGIDDSIENAAFTPGGNDLTVDAAVISTGVTGFKGNIALVSGLGDAGTITGAQFEDTDYGYGYFRITSFTGDQSSAIDASFNFGLAVDDLATSQGANWATTSTRDVAFVSNGGTQIHANVTWGAMEHEPLTDRYSEIFHYEVPISTATFRCSADKLNTVLSDLAYIEIRSEFWGGVSGNESILVPAGSYYGGSPDNDGDGTPDYLDSDSDGDGISDAVEGANDSDGDGAANYYDRDADGDGILDSTETTNDADGDGTANYLDTDADGDGQSDTEEGTADPDNDGTANYLDTDADNDGIKDSAEGLGDNDGDGLVNYLDSDSDEDGIPDGLDPDADGDGIANTVEAFAVGSDGELVSNGDFEDGATGFTSDYPQDLSLIDEGTPQPNGAFEIAEDPIDVTVNFASFGDNSGGGEMMVVWSGPNTGELVWSQTVTVEPEMTYVFSAAVATALPGREPALDFRVDGVSLGVPIVGGDGGVWERTYASYTNDSSTEVTIALYNVKTTLQQTGFGLDDISFKPYTTDTDGDGAANFLDQDSDGDTLPDSFETTLDFDGDGLPNFLDLDSDNDTIPDQLDGDNDPDNDGQAGYNDLDSDNDNIEDFREGGGDFDGDGIPDHEDTDSDNDGTPDAPGADTDGDGLWNEEETLAADTDNDGTPDYLDLDSDGDGLSDAVEGFNDTDNDGVYDYIDHQPAFTCSGYAFQSYNANTQFALVDVNQGVFINVGDTSHGLKYNAIAYNPVDDYVYGLNRSTNDPELLRIGSDGSVAKVGLIDGLPRSYVAGTFTPDGIYWVSGGGRIFGIDITSMTVVHNYAHSPNPSGTEIDIAYNPINETMYGSTTKGKFFSVDLSDGSTTVLGSNGKTFGALICDFNGAVYGFDNKGTGAFRISLTDGQVTWVASSPTTGINDGTICPNGILNIDTDGDGIDDETDLDDDNDGIQDQFEGCHVNPNGDEDGDGIRNWTDYIDDGDDGDGSATDYTDSNGDGIPDVFDVDGDGTPNHLDTDSDNDGLDDSYEAGGDADGDGCDNFLDEDADNDGVTDGTDGTGDTDGDGTPDYLDPFDDRDEDGDGIPNGTEGTGDFDGDGIPNHLDTDSDDDGFPDAEEAGSDPTNPRDSDGDSNPNYLDFDDDNDGIPTASDPCPLCNLDDNYIEFDITNVDILATYDVRPAAYSFARDIWNEVKYELNCNTEGIPLEQHKRGFNEEDFLIESDSEVFVTVIYDGGNHINTVSYYDAADPVNSWGTVWQKFATGPTAPLISGSSASIGVVPAGTEFRLGLVMDGGNGGTDKIHMDSYLNPGGQEFAACKIDLPGLGDPLIVAFEDELSANRDNDFNDVILLVQIVPLAQGTAQFNGVVAGDTGQNAASVSALLQSENLNNSTYEKAGKLIELPETGSVTFELIDDTSDFAFTLALYDYSEVAKLSPHELYYGIAAATECIVVLDDRLHNDGASVTFDPATYGLAGQKVGLMLIPSNIPENYLRNPHRYTPKGDGNFTKRQPLFSHTDANPGTKDQFLFFTDNLTSTIVAIEDHSRHEDGVESGDSSDSNFADVQIKITPALEVTTSHEGNYFQGTADPTINWDGNDGYTGGQNGDF